MADKIVQEADGTSFIDLEDGTGDILLEVSAAAGGGLKSLTLTGVGSWLMWPLLLILNLRN